MRVSENTKVILGLLSLKGIGPATVRGLRNILSQSELSIEQITNANKKVAKALEKKPDAWEQALSFVDEQETIAKREGVKILSFCDTDYPELLVNSKDDPCLIYVKGNLSNTPNDSIAVIGTRKPSEYAITLTESITLYLAQAGQSIVSGLALGCDSIAHETAIKANAHTVAVMAHGLQTISPASNSGLAERILSQGGALITQYPFGQKPSPYLFMQRDKTQAAMARGVVMVESGLKGGSLHASSASLANNRWLAIPPNSDQEITLNANEVLIHGTEREKADLLKCDQKLIRNCFILESESDYLKLLKK